MSHASPSVARRGLEWPVAPPKARPKYGNVQVVGRLGELYDSKAEREYADMLEHRRKIGIISRWSWSPRFILQADPPITVRFDFVFWTLDDRPRVVDVKGAPTTRDFSVKARLWKAQHSEIPLVLIRKGVEHWQ